MKCQRCEKESTGTLIHLCDDHFDEWEREVFANPSEVDIAPVDNRLVYQKGGGVVPDDVEAVAIKWEPHNASLN